MPMSSAIHWTQLIGWAGALTQPFWGLLREENCAFVSLLGFLVVVCMMDVVEAEGREYQIKR